MAYQTGINVANLTALMNLLRDFAVADGWTLNQNNWPTWLSLTSGQCTVHFTREINTESTAFGPTASDHVVNFWLSSSYNSGLGQYAQPGALVTGSTDSDIVQTNDMEGPFLNYWFFSGGVSDPKYVYAVVESTAGYFSHIYFGNLDKLGASYTGGAFAYGSYYTWWAQNATDSTAYNVNWNPAIDHRILFDDRQNCNIFMGNACPTEMVREIVRPLFTRVNTSPLTSRGSTSGKWADMLFTLGTNPVNGVTPFLPCPTFVEYTTDSNLTQCPGMLPNIRMCSMNGRAPREVVTITPDTWMIFPMRRQTDTANIGTPTSGTKLSTSWNYGIAVRRIT